MNKWQKIALGVFCIASITQAAGGLIVLKRCEELEEHCDRLRMAGIYALSIMERENIDLNQFDVLAFEALRPNLKTDKGEV